MSCTELWEVGGKSGLTIPALGGWERTDRAMAIGCLEVDIGVKGFGLEDMV
ncbi:MAG: hypothetical protein SWY16_12160 [Cyanobacteriota bacterium]|nr:hypothetical protein [Cyanobacteriota bacterium]